MLKELLHPASPHLLTNQIPSCFQSKQRGLWERRVRLGCISPRLKKLDASCTSHRTTRFRLNTEINYDLSITAWSCQEQVTCLNRFWTQIFVHRQSFLSTSCSTHQWQVVSEDGKDAPLPPRWISEKYYKPQLFLLLALKFYGASVATVLGSIPASSDTIKS